MSCSKNTSSHICLMATPRGAWCKIISYQFASRETSVARATTGWDNSQLCLIN